MYAVRNKTTVAENLGALHPIPNPALDTKRIESCWRRKRQNNQNAVCIAIMNAVNDAGRA